MVTKFQVGMIRKSINLSKLEQFEIFCKAFGYETEQQKAYVLNNYNKEVFTWCSVLGTPTLLGMELKIKNGVTYSTVPLPLTYKTEANDFVKHIIKKLESFWIGKNDWTKYFEFGKKTNDLEWSYKVAKFITPEVYKQHFGTQHNVIKFHEIEENGKSEFGGIAVSLPYDWHTNPPSKYQAQNIVLTQLMLALRCLEDHHKKLLIECILNTKDQYYNYLVNSRSKEPESIEDFLGKRDFLISAALNRNKYGMAELIQNLKNRMREYNFSASDILSDDSGQSALIVPRELMERIIQDPNNHLNTTKGHKNKEGFYNKENDVLKNFIKINGTYVFPLDKFKNFEFPDGKQLLESNRQEIYLNLIPSGFELMKNNLIQGGYDNNRLDFQIPNFKSKRYDMIKFDKFLGKLPTYQLLKSSIGMTGNTFKNFNEACMGAEVDEYYNLAMNGFIDNYCRRVGYEFEELKTKVLLDVQNQGYKVYILNEKNKQMTTVTTARPDYATILGARREHAVLFGLVEEIFEIIKGLGLTIEGPGTNANALAPRSADFMKLKILYTLLPSLRNVIESPESPDVFGGIHLAKNDLTLYLYLWEPLRSFYRSTAFDIDATDRRTLNRNGLVNGPTPHARGIGNYVFVEVLQNVDLSQNGAVQVPPNPSVTGENIYTLLQNLYRTKNLLCPIQFGFFREAIFPTHSGIFVLKKAIQLYTGDMMVSPIKNPQNKDYVIDMERPFGVKPLDKDGYLVAEDIYYGDCLWKCCPHSGFEPEASIRNKLKPTSGGIIPFVINYDSYKKMRTKLFIPKTGKYGTEWTHIVDDGNVLEQVYEPDTLIKSFNSKYQNRLYDSKRYFRYKYKHLDGFIKPSDLVHRGPIYTRYPSHPNTWKYEPSPTYVKYILDDTSFRNVYVK